MLWSRPPPTWSVSSVHYLESYSRKMSFSSSLLAFSLRGAQVFSQNVTLSGSKRLLSYRPLLQYTQNYQIRSQNGTTHHSLHHQPYTTFTPYLWKCSNLFTRLRQDSSSRMHVRTVTKYSKLGKRKTVKSVAKRFIRTGSGKLKYWPAGKVHNMLAKSRKKRLQLRKARYATKTQLKTLNKMISGW